MDSGCRERKGWGEVQGTSGHSKYWVGSFSISRCSCAQASATKENLRQQMGRFWQLSWSLSPQLLLWKAQKHQVLSWNGGLLMGTMKTFRVRHTKQFLPSWSPSVPKVSCSKKQGDLYATIMLLVAAPTVGLVQLLDRGWSPLFQSGFPGRDRWQSVEWNCLSSSTSVRRHRKNMMLLPFPYRTVTSSWG